MKKELSSSVGAKGFVKKGIFVYCSRSDKSSTAYFSGYDSFEGNDHYVLHY